MVNNLEQNIDDILLSDHSMSLVHIIKGIERYLNYKNPYIYSITVNYYKEKNRYDNDVTAYTKTFSEDNLKTDAKFIGNIRSRAIISVPQYITKQRRKGEYNNKPNTNERKKQARTRIILAHEISHILYHIKQWEETKNKNYFQFPKEKTEVLLEEELYAWFKAYEIIIRKSEFYQKVFKLKMGNEDFPFIYGKKQLLQIFLTIMDEKIKSGDQKNYKEILQKFQTNINHKYETNINDKYKMN